MQLIILMDSILKRYGASKRASCVVWWPGLDLQLTPYQVIALSRNDGMVDFVPESANLSKVLREHNGDLQQFFRSHHPAEKTERGPERGKGSSRMRPWGPHNSYGIKAEVRFGT